MATLSSRTRFWHQNVAQDFKPASSFIQMKNAQWRRGGYKGSSLKTWQDHRFNEDIAKDPQYTGFSLQALGLVENQIYQPTEYADKDFRVYSYIIEATMFQQRQTERADKVDIQRDYFPDDLFSSVAEPEPGVAMSDPKEPADDPAITGKNLRDTLVLSLEALEHRLEDFGGAPTQTPTNTFMYALAAGAILLFWEAVVG